MSDPQRRRQRRILVGLGLVLLAAGLAVMFLLRRAPLPLRLFVGLTDAIAGLVLLLVAQQKFSDR